MKPILLSALLGVCGIAGAAEGAAWRIGVASVNITPEHPVVMSGYGGRLKPFERVAQDIFAKALVLEDEDGQRAVLVTSDLASMGRTFAHATAAHIMERTGLSRDRIILSWSHSHAGPELSLNPAPGPGESAANAQHRVAYTRSLQERLVELVAQADSRREPARLSYGQGVVNFVMSRREFTPDGVVIGVNPRGYVDRSVPVLRVEAVDGRLLAILCGAACHNTTLGSRNYELCGDYAGYAQHILQEKHPGAQALFMMGCGGDANPYPKSDMAHARAHGAELAAEVTRVIAGPLQPVSGPLRAAMASARLPLRPVPREQLAALANNAPRWQVGNARHMLSVSERGGQLPDAYEAPVAVWQFGDSLTLVALSGEPVADYVPAIERAIGPLRLWIAGYCNEDFGYLPSARMVAEGGYETRGLNSGAGWFAPEAESVVVETVRALAQRVGRR